MKKSYIWEYSGWPYLTWDNKELSPLLGQVRNRQGQLTGKISLIGNDLKKKTLLDTIVSDIMASARIEGGMPDEIIVTQATEHYLSRKKFNLSLTDDISTGAVQVYIDALYNYKQTITEERLFRWKFAFEGRPDFDDTDIGWHETDLIFGHLPSIPVERKMEYLNIPIPENTQKEMKSFFTWVNTVHPTDPVIKAGVAYLRVLLVRPFERDNGRIARNIAGIFLSRADNLPERFYSISAQIERDRDSYHKILQHIQTGTTDITEWLRWFLYCMENALAHAEEALTHVMNKSRFFDKYRLLSLNERQLNTVNLLWDGFNGKLSSSVWASLNQCSPDTALRDIQDLITKKVLQKEKAGGRSTSYCLHDDS